MKKPKRQKHTNASGHLCFTFSTLFSNALLSAIVCTCLHLYGANQNLVSFSSGIPFVSPLSLFLSLYPRCCTLSRPFDHVHPAVQIGQPFTMLLHRLSFICPASFFTFLLQNIEIFRKTSNNRAYLLEISAYLPLIIMQPILPPPYFTCVPWNVTHPPRTHAITSIYIHATDHRPTINKFPKQNIGRLAAAAVTMAA